MCGMCETLKRGGFRWERKFAWKNRRYEMKLPSILPKEEKLNVFISRFAWNWGRMLVLDCWFRAKNRKRVSLRGYFVGVTVRDMILFVIWIHFVRLYGVSVSWFFFLFYEDVVKAACSMSIKCTNLENEPKITKKARN